MSRRAGAISLAVVTAIGLVGLGASAARSQRWTSFTLRIRARDIVTTVLPRRQICQTPVSVLASAGGIEAWAWPTAQPAPRLIVLVLDRRGHKVLATGQLPSGYAEVPPPRGYPSPVSLRARLSRTLSSNQRVTICLLNAGKTPVSLLGSTPNRVSGTLSSEGKSTGSALALLFLRPHSQSLFSMLPAIFRRASLFRPGWVGAWTFWLLAAAMLGAFGLGAVAVAKATEADGA
jgi:hypothetical protein